MPQEINNETTTNVVKFTAATARISRGPSGVKITVKSKLLEELFKQASGGLTINSDVVSGGVFYKIPRFNGVDISRMDIDGNIVEFNRIERSIEYGGYYNMSILRAVGLTDGVTFEINTPVKLEQLEAWVAMLKKTVNHLYLEYIAELNMEISITVLERMVP